MKKFSYYIFSGCCWLLLILVAVTCKKEYSFEGGLSAQYAFLGSPQQCTQATVNGTYTAGTTIHDSLNSVSVNLDITRKGSFSVITPTVDGISFSASGTFNATCSKCSLLLTCQGTPDSAGVFTFSIPGTNGCYFTVTVDKAHAASYTLSGAPNDCTKPVEHGQYTAGNVMTAENTVSIDVQVAQTGHYYISTDTVNGFSFSASGSFTTLGAQTVVLKTTGRPAEAELSQFRLHADNSVCTFYVPVVNREPLATYVLQSGALNNRLYCSPGSLQGIYTVGTPLNSSNTLTVNAYVKYAGNFTIATTAQNGIRFSYTGTFATTGAQDVVLKGSGTPIAIGTYTLTPMIIGPALLGGSTCGLDVKVN